MFGALVKHLTAQITPIIAEISAALSGGLASTLSSRMFLYIALWGWALARGTVQEPIGETFMRFFKCVIVIMICQSANYTYYITNVLWAMPDALAAMASKTPQSANALDVNIKLIYSVTRDLKSNLGIADVAGWIFAIFIDIFALLVFLCTALILIISKMGLALMLAIMPIFLIMLLFDATRKFFEAWLTQALNFILAYFLATVSTKMMMELIVKTIYDSVNPQDTLGLYPLLIYLIALLIVLRLCMSIASGLAGGIALSTMGFGTAALHRMTNGVRHTMRAPKKAYDWYKNRKKKGGGDIAPAS